MVLSYFGDDLFRRLIVASRRRPALEMYAKWRKREMNLIYCHRTFFNSFIVE